MCLLSLHPNQTHYQIHVVPFLNNEMKDLIKMRLDEFKDKNN